METGGLVVPAGVAKPAAKPHPANYSLRMPSWLSNGETGDRTLLGPLTGLQVSSGTPTSGQAFVFFLLSSHFDMNRAERVGVGEGGGGGVVWWRKLSFDFPPNQFV